MERELLVLDAWQAVLLIFVCSSVGAFWVFIYIEFMRGLFDRFFSSSKDGVGSVTDQAE